MITYRDLDEMATRKKGLSFTMVFSDGDKLTSNLEENPLASDLEIITGCNATNPKRWGKVVEIKDRRPCFYW